tara:strand:- start:853 stop:1083 length:231 start_codon:yes stop_codon:yes gene_type:complete
MITPSEQLRDALGSRLLEIVAEEEELSPAMVSAMVNFLKQFPPPEQLEDLPTAKKIADTLKDYKASMPFQTKVSVS